MHTLCTITFVIQNRKEGMSVQKIEKLPVRLSKQWMIGLLLLSLLFLAACGNDGNNDATNDGNGHEDTLYTEPNNGTNNGNGADMNNNGTNNGVNENGVYDGNDANQNNGTTNQTNEGTINNHDTLKDDAEDIIDDTKDMIEGKDDNVKNPQR